ncbi:MAG: Phosphonate ABC transporter ATP-binding protein [Candidatus Bipolaricaulis sibiricus]|uniref:Phosphonate ABC transporter ATP-binding protein n=1 Tax=Bipolaricaulis sibiricus TaxID=2501609 RepID=A0A410FW00_BIPS1|nr:MAG: Phosphonate ABC transporter ATP-binding protein [Candidatus Bipolaricaulis sibiricus]
MAKPYLVFEHLTKVYERGQVHALRDLSFAVEKGEFLVVIGLSGSGKSTLLRCINRLIEPTSGKIWLDGTDLTRLSAKRMRRVRRRIGMIFQQFNLVDRATTLRNVLTGRLGYMPGWRSLLGLFSAEDRQAALANLARVGLRDKAYARVDELSGGQRQRVGIARALMQKPEILLADEPVSALDPATSHSIMQYLEQMNRQDGVTVIASLHFLSLARRYGTRIVALKDGQLVFDGPPKMIDNAKFKEIYGEDAEEVEVR